VDAAPTRTVIAVPTPAVSDASERSAPRVRSLLDDDTDVGTDLPTERKGPQGPRPAPPPPPLAPTVVLPVTPSQPPAGKTPPPAPPAAPQATPTAAPAATSAPAPAAGGKRRLWPWIAAAAAVLAAVALAGGWLLWAAARRDDAASRQPVAAPRPAPKPAASASAGTVVVLATPWGELASLHAADGHELPLPTQRETPLVITLPAGHYVATLRHPSAPGTATCEIDAVVGQVVTCRAELLPLDPMQYFKDAGWWR
jgi:hypothetical protein